MSKKSVFSIIRRMGENLKLVVVKQRIKKNAVLIGEHQSFKATSRIQLFDGSIKEDIILHDHCDMFGVIISHSGGKVIMQPWSKIARGSKITAVNRVEIGRDTAISYGVEIIDNNNHPINPDDRRYMRHTPHGSEERRPKYSANAPIIIGENVLIGSYSRIQKGVIIGDNSIVASHSVVTHDVPANSIVAGNPAKVVKSDIDKTTSPIFPINKQ
ncbi:MAG: acyltransferase [Bacteroidales bacterium]|nr:acyltransferase [Bacteroidales bacterium]